MNKLQINRSGKQGKNFNNCQTGEVNKGRISNADQVERLVSFEIERIECHFSAISGWFVCFGRWPTTNNRLITRTPRRGVRFIQAKL